MSFSQYLLDSHEQYRQQVRLRNIWIIRLRWGYLVVLGAVAIVTSYTTTREPMNYRQFVAGLVALGLALNLGLWVWTRFQNLKIEWYHSAAIIQILLDTSLAAFVVYFQGGIDSRATVLFAIPILATGVLFKPIFAYTVAASSSAFYVGSLMAYHLSHPESYASRDIILPAVFYSFVFFLLALIVSGYTARTNAREREESYAELLSLLRHQLHHPSGVIAAIVEVLEHSEAYKSFTPKERGYVKQLEHENQRIHAMITNVLQLAQTKDDEDVEKPWSDVNLMVLVNECATNVATAYKRLQDLEVNIPHENAIVHGQPDNLQLAFENILENAFKFSNPGSKVTINMFSKKVPTIEIDIQDHGAGISEKDQRQLFRAFTHIQDADETGKNSIKSYSMGLGLYISKLIIERHGGTLKLESLEGQGTKVIVQLKRDMWRYTYGQK